MSDVVAIGLSTDTVATAMATLMRHRISATLQIPLDAIVCCIYLSGKKASPEFTVDQSRAGGVSAEQITQTIRELWGPIKGELEARLADLRMCRGRYAQKEAG